MNAIVQSIVNNSTLEVTWIKITNATPDSFTISLESFVNGTGPIGVTMSEMDLDMTGSAGVFGRLHLPQINTKSSGTTVSVTDQVIKITDMEAYKAFVKALMQDKALVLRLENGHTTIKAFMLIAQIVYSKDVQLKGMDGVKTEIIKTEVDGKTFTNTIRSSNPSPVEIDLGAVKHEILNGKGVKIAEQKGRIYLTRGDTEYVMTGTVTGVALEGEPRLVGVGVEEDNWNNLTIPYFNTPTTLTNEFSALCKA